MSTFCSGVISKKRQMLVKVDVVSTRGREKIKRVSALIDTGANISCISSALAKELDLTCLDSEPATTASGREERSKIWIADLRVIFEPTEKYKEFHNIQVMESYTGIGRMLLGMDIIEQGELYIKDKRFALRF